MENKGNLSDGYHTFNELYAHRNINFILVCALLAKKGYVVFKTKKDHQQKEIEGFFILGVNLPEFKQISYHVSIELWMFCVFAREVAYNAWYDGHNSDDVLKRLLHILYDI